MTHPDEYFEQRERDLRRQGRDPDDDDEWCRPDYEDDHRVRDPWENR